MLADPELCGEDSAGRSKSSQKVAVIEAMRPEVEKAALAVRRLAASLLTEQHSLQATSATSTSRLGGILQIYFHLNELPQAVWSAVSSTLSAAEKAAGLYLNPKQINKILEQANRDAADALEAEHLQDHVLPSSSSSESKQQKKRTDVQLERLKRKYVKMNRSQLAQHWSSVVGDAVRQISTLHRVLALKSDQVKRQSFLQVVAQSKSGVPDEFAPAQNYLRTQAQDQSINILHLFWTQLCLSLGNRMSRLLKYEGGRLAGDVAALYPVLRAASLSVLGDVKFDDLGGGGGGSGNNGYGGGEGLEGFSHGASGSLGGNIFQQEAETESNRTKGRLSFNTSADSWTVPASTSSSLFGARDEGNKNQANARAPDMTGGSDSNVLNSTEWKIIMGEYSPKVREGAAAVIGLSALHSYFQEVSLARLCATLPGLFAREASMAGLDMETEGVHTGFDATEPTFPTLPSRYDLTKLETLIKDELALADPRQGGGEFSMVPFLCNNVVQMIAKFCRASQNATSSSIFDKVSYLQDDEWAPTEVLSHDFKLTAVISSFLQSVKAAPDDTFIAPYRPAHSAQHEDAARICKLALAPGIKSLESLVYRSILKPLCRTLNQRLSRIFSKMHLGAYTENESGGGGGGSSFVQSNLSQPYEQICTSILSKLPSEFGYHVASMVSSYSIYAFTSNVALARPLGEMGRMSIIQDLADLELSLEHLLQSTGGSSVSSSSGFVQSSTSSPLAAIEGGKPYHELRAMRSMLFWDGLTESSEAPPDAVVSNLLSEDWVKDVRPSTLLHYLFSLAPNLLSSPHHAKRMTAQDYVAGLVRFEGSDVEDGEAKAWMTTMACCDSYQQRESTINNDGDDNAINGDKRIAAILMALGPELLRYRQH